MSVDNTPLGQAKAARTILNQRATASRLGKSIFREADLDILAMRQAVDAFDALIKEVDR